MCLQATQEQQQELQLQLDSMDGDAMEASRAAAEAHMAECQAAVISCREQLHSIHCDKVELSRNCEALESRMQVMPQSLRTSAVGIRSTYDSGARHAHFTELVSWQESQTGLLIVLEYGRWSNHVGLWMGTGTVGVRQIMSLRYRKRGQRFLTALSMFKNCVRSSKRFKMHLCKPKKFAGTAVKARGRGQTMKHMLEGLSSTGKCIKRMSNSFTRPNRASTRQ